MKNIEIPEQLKNIIEEFVVGYNFPNTLIFFRELERYARDCHDHALYRRLEEEICKGIHFLPYLIEEE